jgi:lipopolysaccharide heptosyltransferase II
LKTNAIDWQKVDRVLLIRLRSIGDTVLATPSLIALRKFLPNAQIDILLEDWVAPLLEGFDANVIVTKKSKLKTAKYIRQNKYDVVFNLHGGTTATFLTFASGAKYRVGYADYRYARWHNRLLSSSADFWQKPETHSAEQQLALLGFAGVPVQDKPKSRLSVSDNNRVRHSKIPFALIHPAAAFESKQWSARNFAQIADVFMQNGMQVVAVGTKKERETFDELKKYAQVPIQCYDNLSLPQITNLASRAKIFVGNDSGIAHIAAAVNTPSVVIFGSSNMNHWSPWTDAANEVVFEEMPCNPCAGYVCKEFEKPECIRRVSVDMVTQAIERVLKTN